MTLVAGTHALRVAGRLCPGLDIETFNADNAPLLDRNFRDTIALGEVEEPDVVADRVVDTMLLRAARDEVTHATEPAAAAGAPNGPSGRVDRGRRIGRKLLLELVLARGPAFRVIGLEDVDEVCVTLVHRVLERLDGTGSRVPRCGADQIASSLIEAVGEDAADGIVDVLATFVEGDGAGLGETARSGVPVWLAAGMRRLRGVAQPVSSGPAASDDQKRRRTRG